MDVQLSWAQKTTAQLELPLIKLLHGILKGSSESGAFNKAVFELARGGLAQASQAAAALSPVLQCCPMPTAAAGSWCQQTLLGRPQSPHPATALNSLQPGKILLPLGERRGWRMKESTRHEESFLQRNHFWVDQTYTEHSFTIHFPCQTCTSPGK